MTQMLFLEVSIEWDECDGTGLTQVITHDPNLAGSKLPPRPRRRYLNEIFFGLPNWLSLLYVAQGAQIFM